MLDLHELSTEPSTSERAVHFARNKMQFRQNQSDCEWNEWNGDDALCWPNDKLKIYILYAVSNEPMWFTFVPSHFDGVRNIFEL